MASAPQLLRRVLSELEHSERLYSSSNAIRPASPRVYRPMSWRQADEVVELAFLKAFIQWEAFQEEIFEVYLQGKPTAGGRSLSRYVTPRDPAHARRFYVDRRGRSDWSAADLVLDRASLLLRGGGTFRRALMRRRSDLDSAKVIRNAIAHAGQEAWEKYDKHVRGVVGFHPPGLSVGGFLARHREKQTGLPYFEFYVKTLRDAAREIAG